MAKQFISASSALMFVLGCLLITGFYVQGTTADIENNEVEEFPEYYMIQGVKVYQGDRECALVGGLCVHGEDCNQPTMKKGLCPTNAHRGVECCYELPLRPAPCEQHLGECMDSCHKTLVRPGTDCVGGQVCCVLIH